VVMSGVSWGNASWTFPAHAPEKTGRGQVRFGEVCQETQR
jgi:hypothetical protein